MVKMVVLALNEVIGNTIEIICLFGSFHQIISSSHLSLSRSLRG